MNILIFTLGFLSGMIAGMLAKKVGSEVTLEAMAGKTVQSIGLRKAYIVPTAAPPLVAGLLFLACYERYGLSIHLYKAFALTGMLLIISLIDIEESIIPDFMVIMLSVTGALFAVAMNSPGLSSAIAGALLGGGMLLLVALLKPGGLGGGDVKLMAGIGFWLGIRATGLSVLLCFLLGGIGALRVLLSEGGSIKDNFAYGPYIAMSAFLCLLFEEQILVAFALLP